MSFVEFLFYLAPTANPSEVSITIISYTYTVAIYHDSFVR